MTKDEQFLWIVQTAILANGINLSQDEETREQYRHEYSSTGVRITMEAAIHASQKIPADMNASEAADEFCIYMFSNHRDTLEPDDELRQVPAWFAR